MWDDSCKFSNSKFYLLIKKLDLLSEWPTTPKGRLKTSKETFELFDDIWSARITAGKSSVVSSASELCRFENVANPIRLDPNQTLRSWAAVINYMLRDYKFIHE